MEIPQTPDEKVEVYLGVFLIMIDIKDGEYLMGLALEQAEKAYRCDEVPVGAVLTDRTGKILSKTCNLREQTVNPCGHAEILAICEAAKLLKSWRLTGCRLFVTLEPCLMCLGAALQSRLEMIGFGAYDPKGGALSLNYNFYQDKRLNHALAMVGGIRHYQCADLLSRFFKEKRHFKRASG